jgi:hypothetical protein
MCQPRMRYGPCRPFALDTEFELPGAIRTVADGLQDLKMLAPLIVIPVPSN